MAYKKYIKRGGKIYGPYLYHSKRVDGKVVSEYHGQDRLDYKKFLVIGFGVFIFIVFAFVLIFSNRDITGRAVMDLSANYQQGEPLEGQIKLSLQEGELVPLNSKVIFENNGNSYEYDLSQFVSDDLNEGNFYVQGSSVSGSGQGYGISGRKEVSPEVYFVLNILSESNPASPTPSGGESSEEASTEEQPAEETQQLDATTNEQPEQPEPETSSNTPQDTETSVSQGTETAPQESTIEEPINSQETDSTNSQENVPDEQKSVAEEQPSVSETTEESASEPTPAVEEAPVTGNIISNLLLGLGFRLTGNAVVEFEREVQGSVSVGEDFTYVLNEGERAELKPRSVRTDSKQLDDDDIVLNVEGNQVIITTNYIETEEGFGQDYLGQEVKEINIDVSDLGLVLEPGNLKVSLVDSGNEIIFVETTLEPGEIDVQTEPEPVISQNTTTAPEEKFNETAQAGNTTNRTQVVILPNVTLELVDEERAVLNENFGNVSVKISNVVEGNGVLSVRYELDGFPEYWAEFNYDNILSQESLNLFMERDRIKWLKDIAKRLSQDSEPEKEFTNFSSVGV